MPNLWRLRIGAASYWQDHFVRVQQGEGGEFVVGQIARAWSFVNLL